MTDKSKVLNILLSVSELNTDVETAYSQIRKIWKYRIPPEKKQPTEIDDFYNTLKSDPAKIVEWAESEIKAYNELIKLAQAEQLEAVKSAVTDPKYYKPQQPDSDEWIPVKDITPAPKYIDGHYGYMRGYFQIECLILTKANTVEYHLEKAYSDEQCTKNFKSWGHFDKWQPLPSPPKNEKP